MEAVTTIEHVGYKQLRGKLICVLKILGENTESRKVIDKQYAKFRTSKAQVMDIYSMNDPQVKFKQGSSIFDDKFIYTVGETIEVENYDRDHDEPGGYGIHYFLSEEAARCFILSPPYVFDEFSDFNHYNRDGMLLSSVTICTRENIVKILAKYEKLLKERNITMDVPENPRVRVARSKCKELYYYKSKPTVKRTACMYILNGHYIQEIWYGRQINKLVVGTTPDGINRAKYLFNIDAEVLREVWK